MGEKLKVLLVAHLGPKITGAVLMNQQLDSIIRNNFKYSKRINISDTKFWLFTPLKELIKAKKNDVVIYTGNVSGLVVLKDWILIRLIKFVIRPKKLFYYSHSRGLSRNSWILNLFVRDIFFGVYPIILSSSLKDDIIPKSSNAKVSIIENFSSIEEYYEANENKGILYLSNFITTKGVLDFIEVISSLPLNPSLNITIAGSFGYDINKTDLLLKINESKHYINFVENPSFKQKIYIFKHSHIFVFPSTYECFPLVILEAMSHGLYTIAYDTGAIKDILKNPKTGIVVKDKRQLSEELVKINSSTTDIKKCIIQEIYNNLFSQKKFEIDFISLIREQ
jgi:glycosyltransferase involved in cell wall biosynthesis